MLDLLHEWKQEGDDNNQQYIAYIAVSLTEYVCLSSTFQRLRKMSLYSKFTYEVFISTVGLDVY